MEGRSRVLWLRSSLDLLLLYTSIWCSFSSSEVTAAVPTLDEFLTTRKDLTKFFELVKSNEFLMSTLKYKEGTFFAPDNAGIAKYGQANYGQELTMDKLLYHFTNAPKYTGGMDDFGIPTDVAGNNPVWATRTDSQIYLNAARILTSNLKFRVPNGKEQIVQVIDSVLEPTIPRDTGASGGELLNPDALKFLEHAEAYTISSPHRVQLFKRRVEEEDQVGLYRNVGRHTFLVPVDKTFETIPVGQVDKRVIGGHVIVDRAVFLGQAKLEDKYQTSDRANNVPIEVRFKKNPGSETWTVTSENHLEDQKHRKGISVQATILKANIPVKNGVVHLLSRPLVIVSSDIWTILKDSKSSDGPMGKFFEILQEFGGGGLQNALTSKTVTVFVPSYQAINGSEKFQEILQHAKRTGNLTLIQNILRLHVVEQQLTSEDIITKCNNENKPFGVRTMHPFEEVFFNAFRPPNSQDIISVDGGGTSASVTHKDIGATNGVIHMIDHVLGVGGQTIFDKLRADSMLKSTYYLSKQDKFNENFKEEERNYTFFAPYNMAWEDLEKTNPSAHLKLFKGTANPKRILDRHLIVGHAYTMEQLLNMSNPGGNISLHPSPVKTLTGNFMVSSKDATQFENVTARYGSGHRRNETRFHGDFKYVLFWNNLEIRVFRPDVKCANGILHVIDTVMMTSDDVVVSSAETLRPRLNPVHSLWPLFAVIFPAVILIN